MEICVFCSECGEKIDLKYSNGGMEKDFQKVICFECGKIHNVSVVRIMERVNRRG